MDRFSKEDLNLYFDSDKELKMNFASGFSKYSTLNNSTCFLSRYIKGSDVEQRVFASNCEDVLHYSREELEESELHSNNSSNALMNEIINDVTYDDYLNDIKSFIGIDFKNYLRVDDLYDHGKLYKCIIDIAPLYQDDTHTYWITFLTNVDDLGFNNSEINETLSKVGVILVKNVIKDGHLHTVDDEYLKLYFGLETCIDEPMSYLETHLIDPNSVRYNKDYRRLSELALDGQNVFEQKIEWVKNDRTYYLSILSVVTARSKSEISLISVISDETDIYHLEEKINQKNDELSYALGLTKSYIVTIDSKDQSLFSCDISTIQAFRIQEEDYEYLGNGVYTCNWHQKLRNYFNITFSELFDMRQKMNKLQSGKLEEFEIILKRSPQVEKDSQDYFLLVFSRLTDKKFIGVITDITDRHENEVNLFKTQKMFEAASSAGGIGVWYINTLEDSEHVFCTDTLAYMYDLELTPDRKYKREDWYEKIRKSCSEEMYAEINEKAIKTMKGISNTYDITYPFKKEDGTIRWYQEISSNIERDEFGNAIVLPGVTLDVTDSVMREEAARLEAITCSLTGLKNRIAFEQGYEAHQYRDKIIYFMDLDDFGTVNANYSHQHGDEFLRATGRKLSSLDFDADVYRIGGDEFMIIVDKYDKFVVKKIFEAVKDIVYINDVGISLTSSLGVIDLKKHDVDSFDDLLSLLSMTMNEAKSLGKNYYVEVDEAHLTQFARNKILYQKFSKGLKSYCVVPYYQPYIDSRTDKVIGFEALARMVIDGVMYYPSEFITMLEISDNIARLDLIMFENCCKFAVEIEKLNLIDIEPIFSSNLSTRSLRYIKPERFAQVSDKYNIDRKHLEIEVTEQVLINESGYTMIDELSSLGYNIAVDDFSAGYASLKYVSQMAADTLKIDRALLNDLELEKGSRNVIYKAVIELAKDLNLNIVSEGVESKEQAEVLRTLDGEIYQGFYCSEPLSEEDFIVFITNYNKR